MAMRKTQLAEGEYYHVYNRGVDKRSIFNDREDIERFLQCMEEFNGVEPIGSLYENSFRPDQLGGRASKLVVEEDSPLVEFIAYCLNPNHYHFILKQIAERGIEKIMQRIGTGHTMFFNNKHERNGSLFQGRFKAVHIDSNEYLLHVSSYVNLNDRVHQLGGPASKLVRSSFGEYMDRGIKGICEKEIILGQFRNVDEYKKFALSSLKSIVERKQEVEGIEDFLLE
ncbi:transposase [Candidatus Kaiserbacteria bacterium]|nr:transposase [Candidatus Kaiserbacteria bacterium]